MCMALSRTSSESTPGLRTDAVHYFYVWHFDTDWYQYFEDANLQSPLGPEFGGYGHDLVALCLRMRTDRETLIETTDYGRTAIFHLLVPAYEGTVISAPFVFHEGLMPLTITGQRHGGVDRVWFNLRRQPRDLRLEFVSILEREEKSIEKIGLVGLVACWFGVAGCAVAMGACPPR
ncbi:uncharacterized protein BP01DRAFT_360574 [Aspergillus saccharolyticus JOP 1030-1]|uniref:Uncharacterized protein n=1 Tax=Aspergillus saccharolyticus JOP 1030-1 TaxID=1450539 RepID=A0A318Z1Z8_9EURO|nr:hypothetical protein BP01DRAFT_360574 [Aspergillus saccharolyticus JOP 1030-1]PYH41311.1 hypothetical protein BP01DRAFT_360574 [Aspergillus saccharolyticus JOP 1030-1]